MRSGFVFYRSWLEAVKNLPREMQGEVLTAIIEYGLDGVTTGSLKPITSAMLAMVKPQIDANNKRMENGLKGGRPRKSATNEEPRDNHVSTESKSKETKPKPNKNQTETKQNQSEPKEKDKEEVKEKPPKGGEKKDAARAATLSRKEEFYKALIPYVSQYGREMIRAFFDYWSELNKSESKMRYEQQPTWELAKRLATWSKREQQYETNRRTNSAKQEANEYALHALQERIEQRSSGLQEELPKPF